MAPASFSIVKTLVVRMAVTSIPSPLKTYLFIY